MEYLNKVSINNNISEIMSKINSDELINANESTLVYYAIKLIAEIARLDRALQYLAVVDQHRVKGLIDNIQACLDKLNTKIHHTDYFTSLNPNCPYVQLVEKYRNSGTNKDDATSNLVMETGTPRYVISGFLNEMKYPNINTESRFFSRGSDVARDLDGLDSMYRSIEDYRVPTDSMNDFIAGFLSVKPLSTTDSNVEYIKSKIDDYYKGNINSDTLLNEYDKYTWRS